MRFTIRALANIILIFSISGCAFGTRHLTLGYQKGSVAKPQNNVAIYVKPFIDDRVDKENVGRVRNGWGLECAKIVTETNISEWVTSAMRTELNNLGYTVTNYDTKNRVEGSVVEVNVTSMMMYEGKVIVEVDLLQDNKEIFSRKYQGVEQTMNWASTAKSYGVTLEKSLGKAIAEAANDIDRKLSNNQPTGE
jgi:hypothetical protein